MKVVITIGILTLFMLSTCKQHTPSSAPSVKEVIDGAVTRVYESLEKQEMDTIGHAYALSLFTDDEKEALATQYWYFDVNVPVKVSLMRHIDQQVAPFWLQSSGFVKTSLLVKNEEYTYEVWQKEFDKGTVNLGINGFDKHRPVYFISVMPLNPDDALTITDIFPENQHLATMETGAFTYHDWDELVLTEVPETLHGGILFSTIRGRAREAHLVGGFRNTPFPSSGVPDQIMLTWSGSPATTMDIQWRTNVTTKEGTVEYWLHADPADTLRALADSFVLEDRLLSNDRYIHRFTAQLKHLQPGKEYAYRVGSATAWSDISTFQTASDKGQSFSFIWFGDTHRAKSWGDLAQQSLKDHPETAFYSIAGDVVSTGLNRDDWDHLFKYSGDVFSRKPIMPVPGNHDNQDGLGAWMYQELFSLPTNGPRDVGPELTYAFDYKNALFLMIDVTAPIDAQTEWIKTQLANSNATWKFAVFHFPPYSWEEDYPEIRAKWCSLFDQYHVDMVMSGHVHYYMRSKPINNQQVVNEPSDGTIYVISVGIPSRGGDMPPESYAVARDSKGWLYQYIDINDEVMSYKAIDFEGNTIDAFTIEK